MRAFKTIFLNVLLFEYKFLQTNVKNNLSFEACLISHQDFCKENMDSVLEYQTFEMTFDVQVVSCQPVGKIYPDSEISDQKFLSKMDFN